MCYKNHVAKHCFCLLPHQLCFVIHIRLRPLTTRRASTFRPFLQYWARARSLMIGTCFKGESTMNQRSTAATSTSLCQVGNFTDSELGMLQPASQPKIVKEERQRKNHEPDAERPMSGEYQELMRVQSESSTQHVKVTEGPGCLGMRGTRCSRRYSSLLSDRPSHKRRTLQDMTKPLKTWLYENRGNPYPTKKEKVALAMGSEMTLVQVSNWFANARRRLKNTVRQPGLTWSKRIKLYSMHASDDAEGFSVASSLSEEAGTSTEVENSTFPHRLNTSPVVEPYYCGPPYAPFTVANEESSGHHISSSAIEGYSAETANLVKFKQSILHRYLNDSVQHQRSDCSPQPHHHTAQPADRTPPAMRLQKSGSTSSHDYEDVSISPYSTESDRNKSVFRDGGALYDDFSLKYCNQGPTIQPGDSKHKISDAEEMYWMEITAALVLTNMARAKRQQRLL